MMNYSLLCMVGCKMQILGGGLKSGPLTFCYEALLPQGALLISDFRFKYVHVWCQCSFIDCDWMLG